MAIKSRAVTVGTEPTRLDALTDTFSESNVQPQNNSAVVMYFGGSDVTTANGIVVQPGDYAPSIDVQPGDAYYACVAAATGEARVIERGV